MGLQYIDLDIDEKDRPARHSLLKKRLYPAHFKDAATGEEYVNWVRVFPFPEVIGTDTSLILYPQRRGGFSTEVDDLDTDLSTDRKEYMDEAIREALACNGALLKEEIFKAVMRAYRWEVQGSPEVISMLKDPEVQLLLWNETFCSIYPDPDMNKIHHSLE
jgi:hypothetical protein